jgi:hypothetical protein
MFTRSASGRANGALNLLHVTAAFAVQYAIGLVIQLWPAEAGHYPEEAYRTAFGLSLALQAAAFLWFVRPEHKTAFQHLTAHPIHALASSLGLVPAAALSYAHARHAWSLHMAGARAQQQAWRSTAFASFAVSVLLALSVMSTVLSGSVAAGMVASAHAVETRDFADAPAHLPRRFETLDHRPEVVPASLPLGRLRSLTRGASHGED